MSVLLRQAHGFEGLRLAHVELMWTINPSRNVVDPRDLPEGHLDARGASAHPQSITDHPVPGIDQLVLELMVSQAATLAKTASASFPRNPARCPTPALGGIELDIRVLISASREHGFPVGLARPSSNLDDARIISTFSCDIAYSESPTASRASAWSQKNSMTGNLALANRVEDRDLHVRFRAAPFPRHTTLTAT